jgi:hypothetical protein
MCRENKTHPCQPKDALRACGGSAQRKEADHPDGGFHWKTQEARSSLMKLLSRLTPLALYCVYWWLHRLFSSPSIVVDLFLFFFSSRAHTALFSSSNKSNKGQAKNIHSGAHTAADICWYFFYVYLLAIGSATPSTDAILLSVYWIGSDHFWGGSSSSAGQIFANARARINWKAALMARYRRFSEYKLRRNFWRLVKFCR